MALPRVVGLGFCVFLVGFFIFSITTIFRVYQLLSNIMRFSWKRGGIGLAVRIDRLFPFFHQSTKLPVRVVLLELCKLTISPPPGFLKCTLRRR